ncbi:META domain-containing protein [Aequorivita echinoideorum]|uniref:META domain-containing protein n=1 Tax=Aequorivita echinoideorum TaxID=1549647 RepID=A0ABS5S190_9FLAO|nr:META domain-containing protein [Aequorivita echinoideorum]MBT0606967.1 META domain-containing protein [Aequorivita echinoideorum]
MKTLATISTLIIALIFTSCDETKRVIDVAGSVQLSGTYTVSTIKGNAVGATAPTLTFSALDKSLRGTTGCNSVFGNYTLDLYAIDFADLAVSEKACTDKKLMQMERNFLDALKETGSYSIENNTLMFYSKTDRSVLLTATKNTNG